MDAARPTLPMYCSTATSTSAMCASSLATTCPPGVLGTATQLMWIGRPDCPVDRGYNLTAAAHTDAEICLDKLVVLDLLVSGAIGVASAR